MMQGKKQLVVKNMVIIIIFLVISEGLFMVYQYYRGNEARMLMDNYAQSSVQRLQEDVYRKIYTVDTLESILKLTHYDVALFEEWAHAIYQSEIGIDSIQLAPKGVVQYIHPLEGNERAIGHDLLKDTHRDDGARKTIESHDISFIGPVTLIQSGKEAIICRKPIFLDGDREMFWGFSIVVVLVEDLQIENILTDDRYYYSIVGEDPDQSEAPIIYTNYPEKIDLRDGTSSHVIALPGTNWTMNIVLKNNGTYPFIHLLFNGVFMIIGVIICLSRYLQYHQQMRIIGLNEELKALSEKDELTGVYNRRYFNKMIIETLGHEKKGAMGFILLDVDFFKGINDTYGHQAGDEVLIEICRLIKACIHGPEALARWGGEEFILLLPQIDGERLRGRAEEIRQRIEAHDFPKGIHVTVSLGCTLYKDNEGYATMFNRLDRALFEAKDRGRNTTVLK